MEMANARGGARLLGPRFMVDFWCGNGSAGILAHRNVPLSVKAMEQASLCDCEVIENGDLSLTSPVVAQFRLRADNC
eukprot:3724523-Amphidinium_carterae.1